MWQKEEKEDAGLVEIYIKDVQEGKNAEKELNSLGS